MRLGTAAGALLLLSAARPAAAGPLAEPILGETLSDIDSTEAGDVEGEINTTPVARHFWPRRRRCGRCARSSQW